MPSCRTLNSASVFLLLAIACSASQTKPIDDQTGGVGGDNNGAGGDIATGGVNASAGGSSSFGGGGGNAGKVAGMGGKGGNAAGGSAGSAGVGMVGGSAGGGAGSPGTGGAAVAANLLVYDPFETPENRTIEGLNDGIGWSRTSGWRVHYADLNNQIVAGSMSFLNLKTAGNHVHHLENFQGRFVDPTVFGALASGPLVGSPGATVWASILMSRPIVGDANNGNPIFFRTGRVSEVPYDDDAGMQAWVAGAYPQSACGGNWALFNGSPYTAQATCTKKKMIEGNATFLVMKLVFTTTGGTVSLFIDPPVSDTPPIEADALLNVTKSMQFRSVQPGCQGICDFDEIRIGSTFASVAPAK